jgi:hypothetical protein
LPWTHDAQAGRPGYLRALIDEELRVEGLGAHLHRPGLSRRVPFTEMVPDLLLWSANDPRIDHLCSTPRQRRSWAALSGAERARPAPLREWSQPVDSRSRRSGWLITSVTARVVAQQGNCRAGCALRFAPVRSSGFRMPRRERAVDMGGAGTRRGSRVGLRPGAHGSAGGFAARSSHDRDAGQR